MAMTTKNPTSHQSPKLNSDVDVRSAFTDGESIVEGSSGSLCEDPKRVRMMTMAAVDREWDEDGKGVCVPAPISVKDQIRKQNETIRAISTSSQYGASGPSIPSASVPTFTTSPIPRKISKGFALLNSNTPSKSSPATLPKPANVVGTALAGATTSDPIISADGTDSNGSPKERPSVLNRIRLFETRAAANFANGPTGSSGDHEKYGSGSIRNRGSGSGNSINDERYGSDREIYSEQPRREYEFALAEAMRGLDSERRMESRRRRAQDERWDELARQGIPVPEGEIERAKRDRQVVDEQWDQRARDIRQFVRKNYELKFVISEEARENRFLALKKMKERSLSDLNKIDGEDESDKQNEQEDASEDEEYVPVGEIVADSKENNQSVEDRKDAALKIQSSEEAEKRDDREEAPEEEEFVQVVEDPMVVDAKNKDISLEDRKDAVMNEQSIETADRRDVKNRVDPNAWIRVPPTNSSKRNLMRPGIVGELRSGLVGLGMKMSVSFDDVMLASLAQNQSLSPCPGGTTPITPAQHSREASLFDYQIPTFYAVEAGLTAGQQANPFPTTSAVSPISLSAPTESPSISTEKTSPVPKRRRFLSDLSDDEYRKFRDQATSMLVEVMEENHIMVPSKLLPHLRLSKDNVLRRKFWSLGSRKDKSIKTFGVSLETLTERDGGYSTRTVDNPGTEIPEIVSSCIDFIEKEGLNTQGVFRVSGNARKIDSLKQAWDGSSAQGAADVMSSCKAGVNDAAGLLKMFLRELPDPLLTFKLFKPFMGALDIKDVEQRRRAFRYLVVLLPRHNREVARRLFSLLGKIAANSAVNAMDASNLGIVIAPNVLKEKPGRLKKADVGNFAKAAQIVKEMIEIGNVLFEVPEMTTRAQDPLPPRPKSARLSPARLLHAFRRRASI